MTNPTKTTADAWRLANLHALLPHRVELRAEDGAFNAVLAAFQDLTDACRFAKAEAAADVYKAGSRLAVVHAETGLVGTALVTERSWAWVRARGGAQ